MNKKTATLVLLTVLGLSALVVYLKWYSHSYIASKNQTVLVGGFDDYLEINDDMAIQISQEAMSLSGHQKESWKPVSDSRASSGDVYVIANERDPKSGQIVFDNDGLGMRLHVQIQHLANGDVSVDLLMLEKEKSG